MRDIGSETSDEDRAKGYRQLCEPKIGDVVFQKNSGSGAYLRVRVVSGCYLDPTYHRLSNFWGWREIDESGKESSDIKHGYGNFYLVEEAK
jgi:hypothetical protein